MNWNLEGMRVEGIYMGEFSVSGVVDISRVKYGGKISHHIVLDEPIVVYGATRERVILDHEHIQRVSSSAEHAEI